MLENRLNYIKKETELKEWQNSINSESHTQTMCSFSSQ